VFVPADTAGDVYEIWRTVVAGHLSPARRSEFDQVADSTGMGGIGMAELVATGHRVQASFGMLLLQDWRDEISEPGLSNLCTVAERWTRSMAAEAVTLQVEIAAMVETVTTGKDSRPILRSRLGLEGDQRPTLGDLTEAYGLSRERLRQLQERALRRLAAYTARSRRGSLTREVLRDLAALDDDILPGVALHEIAGLVFPDADAMIGLRTLATVAGYPAAQRRDFEAQIKLARTERGARERSPVRTIADAALQKTLFRLIDTAWWPAAPATFHAEDHTRFARTRDVNEREHSGRYRSSKLDRGVVYESQLEHRFLQLCERSQDVTWYQEQPLIIPYEFAGANRVYHPDVLIQLGDQRRILVEIKPAFEMTHAINQAKWSAARDWCRRNGVGLLITDVRTTHEQLLDRQVADQLESALRERLGDSTEMSWPQVRAIQLGIGMTGTDFIACCLRQRWTTHQRPWRLSTCETPEHSTDN
jgi:hypothetical protein